MLNKLLESRSASRKTSGWTITSTAVHVALVVSGLYATNPRPLPANVPDEPTRVYVAPAAPAATRVDKSSAPATGRQSARTLRLPSLDVSIAVDIPVVELAPGVGDLTDFASAPTDGEAGSGASSILEASGSEGTYDAPEVEIPAAALSGNPVPDYPAALRASGVEGQVIAQFVVDRAGRASVASVRIISSTHDLFSESVKTAIPKMRFVPARIRGKPVQQTVRQLFVFKLSR